MHVRLILGIDQFQNTPSKKSHHKVRPGETLSEIALFYGLKQEDIINLNAIANSNNLYKDQILKLPSDSQYLAQEIQRSHTVKMGETLDKISMLYKVSKNDLAKIKYFL